MSNKTQERTLFIIKPDAVQRGLVGAILSRFENKGLKMVGGRFEPLAKKSLEKHYAEHRGQPYYESLMVFMSSGPSLLVVWEGMDAIKVVRKICGKTDGKEADHGTIRGDFGMSKSNNLVHSSDEKSGSAEKEIKIWFKSSQLVSWDKANYPWHYSKEDRA
jgi:nucleoside-diphosphate kinase